MGGNNIKDIIAAAAQSKKGDEEIKIEQEIYTPSLNTILKKEDYEKKDKEEEENISTVNEKELGLLRRIESHSKSYNASTYINVKIKANSATKLKLIASSCSLSQQAILSYLIEEFLGKKQIKNLVEQIKDELD